MKNNFESHGAFSLIELSIAMGVMAVLASSIVPVAIRSFQIRAGEKTALEMSMIEEAGRNYYVDNHAWPVDIPILQVQGYLNSQWDSLNPWHNPYQINSTNLQMTVVTNVPVQWTNLVASHLPGATINNTTVTSTVSSPGQTGFVFGVIVAWSGAIADIPQGWALCDGTNGTPDLRDKFIVGASQDEVGIAKSNIMGNLLKTGGTTTHNHSAQTDPHTLTIAEMPRHHHDLMINDATTSGNSTRYPETVGVFSLRPYSTTDVGGDQSHTHSISSDYNVPPFYALAFIMKL